MRDTRPDLPDREPAPRRGAAARADAGPLAIPEPAFLIERALARHDAERLGHAAALKLWLRRIHSA